MAVGRVGVDPDAFGENTGDDGARGDAVDADVAFAELGGDAAGRMHHRGLGRRIRLRAQARPVGSDAAGVDDAAGALTQHDRRHELHGQHHRAQDHGHLCIELGDVEIGDAALGNSVAGIVEQAIDPAEARCRTVDQRLQLAFARHIGLHEAGRAAKLARQRFARFPPAPGDDDTSAFLDEHLGRSRADSARAAHDHRDLAFECSHVVRLPR